MELPVNNLKMLPAGGDDILSLGNGTNPLIYHLRESQLRLCPLGALHSVPMVLLLKVATMHLASSDA